MNKLKYLNKDGKTYLLILTHIAAFGSTESIRAIAQRRERSWFNLIDRKFISKKLMLAQTITNLLQVFQLWSHIKVIELFKCASSHFGRKLFVIGMIIQEFHQTAIITCRSNIIMGTWLQAV